MKKKWKRGPNGKMQYMYRLRYKAPVTRRGLFGIKHTKMEWKDVWVDWKTYKKIHYRPISLSEMMYYDSLFGD